MPNFKPLASMVREENELMDRSKDGQQFLPGSIMEFLTPPLLHSGGISLFASQL